MTLEKVVFIDGCRTPFLRSGTQYMDLMSYQLGQYAIKGLLVKTGIDPAMVDEVIMGAVISNIKTPRKYSNCRTTVGLFKYNWKNLATNYFLYFKQKT